MDLSLKSATFASLSKIRDRKLPKVHNTDHKNSCPSSDLKLQDYRRKLSVVTYALPETAATIVLAATVARGNSLKPCEDCGGSGICSECKDEVFVLKKLSGESADKARSTAKNMATRYTAA